MTNDSANSEKAAIRVIALHGGREAFLAHSTAQVDDLNARWNQNSALMGSILRAHLFVEHYLERYLQTRNPNLGNIDSARLSFAQKAALLDQKDASTSYLVPGIRRLNRIRNRLAHNLSASVTAEDRDVFLSIGLFRALRDALAAPATPSAEPIDVLEAFAQHAGMALQGASDPKAGYWVQAMQHESSQ